MSNLPGMSGYRKKHKRRGFAKGLEEGMKQGEMSAAQMIAKRKDEAAKKGKTGTGMT